MDVAAVMRGASCSGFASQQAQWISLMLLQFQVTLEKYKLVTGVDYPERASSVIGRFAHATEFLCSSENVLFVQEVEDMVRWCDLELGIVYKALSSKALEDADKLGRASEIVTEPLLSLVTLAECSRKDVHRFESSWANTGDKIYQQLLHRMPPLDPKVPEDAIQDWDAHSHGGQGMIYSGSWNDSRIALKTFYDQAKMDKEVDVYSQLEMAHASLLHPLGMYDWTSMEDSGILFPLFGINMSTLLDKIRDSIGGPHVWAYKLISIASQVSNALAFLHSKGIAHRDVKPENVLVFDNEGICWAKVIDLGSAKAGFRSSDVNSCGTANAKYTPPEIRSRAEAVAAYSKAAVDAYSFGVLLNECLSTGAWDKLQSSVHDDIVDLINSCCNDVPEARPHLQNVTGRLHGALRQLFL